MAQGGGTALVQADYAGTVPGMPGRSLGTAEDWSCTYYSAVTSDFRPSARGIVKATCHTAEAMLVVMGHHPTDDPAEVAVCLYRGARQTARLRAVHAIEEADHAWAVKVAEQSYQAIAACRYAYAAADRLFLYL